MLIKYLFFVQNPKLNKPQSLKYQLCEQEPGIKLRNKHKLFKRKKQLVVKNKRKNNKKRNKKLEKRWNQRKMVRKRKKLERKYKKKAMMKMIINWTKRLKKMRKHNQKNPKIKIRLMI